MRSSVISTVCRLKQISFQNLGTLFTQISHITDVLRKMPSLRRLIRDREALRFEQIEGLERRCVTMPFPKIDGTWRGFALYAFRSRL
jgi:hypothetical protein